jgi:hypothetical protein
LEANLGLKLRIASSKPVLGFLHQWFSKHELGTPTSPKTFSETLCEENIWRQEGAGDQTHGLASKCYTTELHAQLKVKTVFKIIPLKSLIL